MERIIDFESVIDALKNYQLVVIQSPLLTNFSIKDNKVLVKTINAQYLISFKEFEELFMHSIFYYYELKQSVQIENEKDEEYYAFKHK